MFITTISIIIIINMGYSEGGTLRLETLIELKLFNSSFSSSNCLVRVVRACPLIEIRQTVPCRANRGNSLSVNLCIYIYIYIYAYIYIYTYIHISQQYPPPL